MAENVTCKSYFAIVGRQQGANKLFFISQLSVRIEHDGAEIVVILRVLFTLTVSFRIAEVGIAVVHHNFKLRIHYNVGHKFHQFHSQAFHVLPEVCM